MVVSPLVSLIIDQVQSLRRKNMKVSIISSGTSMQDSLNLLTRILACSLQ